MAGNSSKESITKSLVEMKSFLGQRSLQDVLANADEELKMLTNVMLDTAFAGVSSAVNAFWNISGYEKGAAETGVKETMKNPEKHLHSKLPELTGIRTHASKLKKYLDLKRPPVIMPTPAFSREHLQEKKAAIESFIWKKALLSCGVGAVPIPGLSFIFNIAILVDTMKELCKAFGFDEDSFRNLALRTDKPIEVLKSAVKKTPMANQINPALVRSLMTTSVVVGSAMVLEELTDFVPVLGSLVGGVNSFAATFYLLKCFLDGVVEDAESVLAKVSE